MCEMDVFVSFESLDFRMSLDDLGDILFNVICVDRHFLNMIRVSKQAKEYLVSAVPLFHIAGMKYILVVLAAESH